MNIVTKVKNRIKKDCAELGHVESWFYPVHLIAVEKNAKYLFKKNPKADSELVLLAVWCHDLQRIHGIKGDHQKSGADETLKLLPQFGLSKKKIAQVAHLVSIHSGEPIKPKTINEKILVCADAMAHFDNSFYLWAMSSWLQNRKISMRQAKKEMLEKIDLDYNRKLQFDYAKDKLKNKYLLFKSFFETI